MIYYIIISNSYLIMQVIKGIYFPEKHIHPLYYMNKAIFKIRLHFVMTDFVFMSMQERLLWAGSLLYRILHSCVAGS